MPKKRTQTKLPKPSRAIATWTPTQVRRFTTALHPALYILKGKKPIRCDDSLAWAKWMFLNVEKRRVAETKVGPHRVSTVFLGIDHRPDQPPPVLFETISFTSKPVRAAWSGIFPSRYTTWEEAKAGHDLEVRRLKLKLQQKARTGAVKKRRAKPPRRRRSAQDRRHKATRKRSSAGSGE